MSEADPAARCPVRHDRDDRKTAAIAERGKRQRMSSSWTSLGDGPHRCPGSQVALHETRVFLDALLRLPGIRLANPPTLGWCAPIMGYELHGAMVICERG